MGEDEAEEELRRERSEFRDVEEDIILKDAISVSIENCETIGVWLWKVDFFFGQGREEIIKWRDLSRVMFCFFLSRDV